MVTLVLVLRVGVGFRVQMSYTDADAGMRNRIRGGSYEVFPPVSF